jgi:predicted ATPase
MPSKTNETLRVFISNVNLKGFKSIVDLSIDFQPDINILIGKNGSGKSNFFEFLSQAANFNRNNKISFDQSSLVFRTTDGYKFTYELARTIRRHSFEKDGIEDRIGPDEKFLINDQVIYDSTQSTGTAYFDFKNKKYTYMANMPYMFYRLGYGYVVPLFIKYSLPENLNFLASSSSLELNIENYYGFWDFLTGSSFLSNIFDRIERLENEEGEIDSKKIESFSTKSILKELKIPHQILQAVKHYSPIQDVRFNPNINIYKDEKKILADNVKLEFKVNNSWMPWSQLSDGTKRMFYIIAEVTDCQGPVLLEEPELGVHPHQFNLLMNFLVEQSQKKQIIISTHSPKALDQLSQTDLNKVIIADYDTKNGTRLRHLTPKETTKAKRYMNEVGFFSDYWMLSDLEG